MNIKIKKALLNKAKEELDLSNSDQQEIGNYQNAESRFVDIDSNSISVSLLSFFLKNSNNIANKTKALLSMELLGENIEISQINEVWDTKIRKLADVVECFSRIGVKKVNADILFNKTWFPIIAIPIFNPATRYMKAFVFVDVKVSFGYEYINIGFKIEQEHLLAADGKMRKPTLKELFAEFGCRPQQCDLEKHKDSLSYLKKIRDTKKQMLYSGFGVRMLGRNYYNDDCIFIKIGHNKIKERIIIESELEYRDNSNRNQEVNKNHYTSLPLVRVFSFLQKKYFFANVNNLTDYVYDTEAHKRIFLPKNITKLLTTVFSTSIDSFIGDVLDNKHGGMIILAAGNPGIGKTSTAEVYSEMQQMPLYAVDFSELGTDLNSIENSLTTIFRRVEKWNAIVLFDEIDVFLAKREKSDLNRTAIVGVFLRLMDYFRGVMFLTSNRPEVLDFAIHSRITLKIKYPDLDEKTREKIWEDKCEKANINIQDGFSEVSKIELNGREIRNLVRLAKVIYPNGAKQEDLVEMIGINKF